MSGSLIRDRDLVENSVSRRPLQISSLIVRPRLSFGATRRPVSQSPEGRRSSTLWFLPFYRTRHLVLSPLFTIRTTGEYYKCNITLHLTCHTRLLDRFFLFLKVSTSIPLYFRVHLSI